MSDNYMAFCVHKFDGALLKDRKNIKTRYTKHFNENAFMPMFVIFGGMVLLAKRTMYMYWSTNGVPCFH